jgi:hypothetical protein
VFLLELVELLLSPGEVELSGLLRDLVVEDCDESRHEYNMQVNEEKKGEDEPTRYRSCKWKPLRWSYALLACVSVKRECQCSSARKEREREPHVHNILVNDKSRSLRLSFPPKPDLSDRAVLAEEVVDVFTGDSAAKEGAREGQER